MSEPMDLDEAAQRHADFQAAIEDIPRCIAAAVERDEQLGRSLPTYGPTDRYGPEAGPDVPMTSVAGYSGGPDCPCADDPFGCDGACLD